MKIKPIRGTHDLLGLEIEKYNVIKKEISKLAKIYNFNEVQTPIFETTSLFSKQLGDQTDVVLKEMYTFLDRNNDSLTLRPEYTTPMIRSAISNNLLDSLPYKVYGIGPMFRRERPQKGRYRQFNQINFENFGSDNFLADFELILLAKKFIDNVIPNNNCRLFINSLGTRENLLTYKKELSNYLAKNKKNLTKESLAKIEKNPLRVLDSKDKLDKLIVKEAPKINNYLSKSALEKYDDLKKILKNYKINFQEDPNLVRGLDYYCHTVFEFKTELLGSQDTIIGGGRYDGLVKKLGGKDIPGTGWAAGIERIMMLMNNQYIKNDCIHIAIFDEKYKLHALDAYKLLTDKKYSVYWNFKYNFKKSLSKSNELDASFIILVGEEEYNSKIYTLKNLINGKQKKLKLNELILSIKNG